MSAWRFLLLLLICHAVNASFILSVPYKDESCFVVRTPKGPEESLITGSFDLLDDKLIPDPVGVVLLNDKLESLYKSPPRAKSGAFSVVTSGRISVCVRNAMDPGMKYKDKNTRQVGLNVQVKGVDATSGVNSQMQKVSSMITNFKSHYDYMRTRESQHRELTEETFTKILFWSLLETLCVILASVLQIYFMRRFVEKRRF